MSTICSYCGVVSRNACSEYSGQALKNELIRCGNLYNAQRPSALFSAGFHGTAQQMQELEDLWEENAELRRKLSR